MRVLLDKDSQKLTSNSFLLDDDMRYYYSLPIFFMCDLNKISKKLFGSQV